MADFCNTVEEISTFIEKPIIPLTKAKYVYHDNQDKRHLVEGALFLSVNFFRFSADNPVMGRFGHKVFFKPHPKAFDRLMAHEAYIEYALHFVSSQQEDKDVRIFDVSKFKALHSLEELITQADGFYNAPDGVNYYKKMFDGRRSHCVLIMKLSGVGEPGLFRVAGMMPNRKEDYIRKAIQGIA